MKNFLMKMVSISITIIILAILIQPVNAFDGLQDQVYSENFEDGQAQGWELEPGWQIINDNGNKVLSGQGHVWARSNQSCSDCTLSFRLKVTKGSIHLVYRMNDEGRYFIRFDSKR